MPRWPDAMLGASFFIFPSKQDAEKGRSAGGCGFFVGVPWESESNRTHIYAVTCGHAVSAMGTDVIRAHVKGKRDPEYIGAARADWFASSTDDLAVMRISPDLGYEYEPFPAIAITKDIIIDYSIGIGDEVISVGRFVDLEGQRTNRPLLRSGVIAAMPEFPVPRANFPAQDSYIVEMRSRSGFSGSPVYVYLAPPHLRYEESERQIASKENGDPLIKPFEFYGPWLLGVHWGEITIRGPDAPKLPSRFGIEESQKRIELGSGMIGVIPCDRLAQLLMQDERVMKERREYEKDAPDPPMMEQSAASTKADNPSHKEDFTRLLHAATRGPKTDSET